MASARLQGYDAELCRAIDKRKRTAFHWAAMRCCVEVVEQLLAGCHWEADTINAPDDNGCSALDYAQQQADPAVFFAIERALSNPTGTQSWLHSDDIVVHGIPADQQSLNNTYMTRVVRSRKPGMDSSEWLKQEDAPLNLRSR